MDLVERMARALCDYFDELPEQITYSERKRLLTQRDWLDRGQVREAARAALSAIEEAGYTLTRKEPSMVETANWRERFADCLSAAPQPHEGG